MSIYPSWFNHRQYYRKKRRIRSRDDFIRIAEYYIGTFPTICADNEQFNLKFGVRREKSASDTNYFIQVFRTDEYSPKLILLPESSFDQILGTFVHFRDSIDNDRMIEDYAEQRLILGEEDTGAEITVGYIFNKHKNTTFFFLKPLIDGYVYFFSDLDAFIQLLQSAKDHIQFLKNQTGQQAIVNG